MNKYKLVHPNMIAIIISFAFVFWGVNNTVSINQIINIQTLHESIVNVYCDPDGNIWTLSYDNSVTLYLEGKSSNKNAKIATGIKVGDVSAYNKGILIDIPIYFGLNGIFILNIQKAELTRYSYEGVVERIKKYESGSDILWEIPNYNFRTQRTNKSYDWHKQFFYVLKDETVIFNWLIYYSYDKKNNLQNTITNGFSTIFVFNSKGNLMYNYFNNIYPFIYKRGDFNFGSDSLFFQEKYEELLFYFGNEDSVFVMDINSKKNKISIINEEKMGNLTYNIDMSYYMTEIYGSSDNFLLVADPKEIKMYAKETGKLHFLVNNTILHELLDKGDNNVTIEKLIYADTSKLSFILKKATNKKGLHSKDQSTFFLYTVNLN